MIAAALALALATPNGQPSEAQVAAAFTQLKALVGDWRNAERPDSALRIRFSLTAGGTVLVEEWRRGTEPHSLTLYHRDGARLIATHYCPQGNQPRLVLASSGTKLSFRYRDATDLGAGESHLHDLAFNLTDPAHPVRSETYRSKAGDEPSTLRLVREPGSITPAPAR